jgi:hypothetical protein
MSYFPLSSGIGGPSRPAPFTVGANSVNAAQFSELQQFRDMA